jgi:uncharacterized protein (TIGR02246 family)
VTEGADEIGNRVLKHLEDAWNSADGDAFGAQFAEDAQFVDIRGVHHSGRTPVAKGHQAIVDSVYKGSVNKYEAVVTKQLADNVLYVLGRAALNVPAGPLAGDHQARFSVVLSRRDGGDWQIAAFHNTLVAPQEGERPA